MKKKKTVLRMNIKLKILIPVTILIILICTLMGISSYQKMKANLIKLGMEQAQTAANITINAIDGDTQSAIEKKGADSPEYEDTLKILREYRDECDIQYLYTLYTDGETVFYGVDSDDSEQQCSVGEEFESSYQELESVFEGKAYIQDYIDSTIYGDLITVYEPIYNSNGDVVAVLGSDFNAAGIISTLESSVTSIVLMAIFCMVISIIILNLIISSITRKLKIVDQKLFELANHEGDLTQTLEVKSGDELEQIANNVNSLLAYIRRIMLHISDNSNRLESSSQEVVDHISGTEMNINDVSATMEEMSAAMEETTASINQINEAVEEAFQAIGQVANHAEEGNQSTAKIQRHASEIQKEASESQEEALEQAKRMVNSVIDKIEKSKAAKEIEQLTNNILSITSQTNLLALNASIEAARAGEAGKGFAVVADEISKLAANSAEAASQIQMVSSQVIIVVDELAQESENMIQFMEDKVQDGYGKLVNTAEEYQEDAKTINTSMQELAVASTQLRENIQDVKEAIEAVNIAVEESAKGIVYVSGMSVDLTNSVGDIGKQANGNMEVVKSLEHEVRKFKLE